MGRQDRGAFIFLPITPSVHWPHGTLPGHYLAKVSPAQHGQAVEVLQPGGFPARQKGHEKPGGQARAPHEPLHTLWSSHGTGPEAQREQLSLLSCKQLELRNSTEQGKLEGSQPQCAPKVRQSNYRCPKAKAASLTEYLAGEATRAGACLVLGSMWGRLLHCGNTGAQARAGCCLLASRSAGPSPHRRLLRDRLLGQEEAWGLGRRLELLSCGGLLGQMTVGWKQTQGLIRRMRQSWNRHTATQRQEGRDKQGGETSIWGEVVPHHGDAGLVVP